MYLEITNQCARVSWIYYFLGKSNNALFALVNYVLLSIIRAYVSLREISDWFYLELVAVDHRKIKRRFIQYYEYMYELLCTHSTV